MTQRTWLITGVSSGFGRHLTEQLLDRGDRVIGTVRRLESVADFTEKYPETFRVEVVDVRDIEAIRAVVDRAVADFGRIDVAVNNAGYGLFGAAEELSDEQVVAIIATNLTAPIQMTRAVLPHMRKAGGGRIIEMSSYGGQVAFPGNSLYHATKWGLEGFAESVAQEVAPFGIGVTIVEPGGARTEFRYGSAQVADPLPEDAGTPARSFEKMLDPNAAQAPGDPPSWPQPSSTASTSNRRPCVSCSAHKPSTRPSPHSRRASQPSEPRATSRRPPTSPPTNKHIELIGVMGPGHAS